MWGDTTGALTLHIPCIQNMFSSCLQSSMADSLSAQIITSRLHQHDTRPCEYHPSQMQVLKTEKLV